MQCVILAAGRGTRMGVLTDTCPKPLLSVAGKPILSHIIDSLPHEIDEVILVVGYRADMITEYYGTEYGGRKITYSIQENPKGGTGDSLRSAKTLLQGKFLVMYGDDIHGKDTLKEAVQKEGAILSVESETPERYGVLVVRKDGTLESIIEKPENPPSNLINIGGFVLDTSIFSYDVPLSASGELYLTDMVTEYAKINPITVMRQNIWIPIGSPEELERAEKIISEV